MFHFYLVLQFKNADIKLLVWSTALECSKKLVCDHFLT